MPTTGLRFVPFMTPMETSRAPGSTAVKPAPMMVREEGSPVSVRRGDRIVIRSDGDDGAPGNVVFCAGFCPFQRGFTETG